jgi:hypothetical protein
MTATLISILKLNPITKRYKRGLLIPELLEKSRLNYYSKEAKNDIERII